MSNPVTVMQAIDAGSAELDRLSKALDQATDLLSEAEEAWDELYDAVAETLKEEMDEAQRKGDPAEHWITATTRKQHRAEYQTWRRAKKLVDKLEKQVKATTAALSGRQSELGALRDELKATGYGTRTGETYGRRAA